MKRALLLALLVAGGARAEEEPTPFWMPPPPPAKKSAPARKAPPAKKPAPVKERSSPAAKSLELAPVERQQAPVEVEAPARAAPAEPAPEPPRTPALAWPAPLPAPAAAAPEPPAAVVAVKPEPEQAGSGRRWSAGAAFGFWGKSRSDGGGRDWQFAYGLRFGRALLPSLEVEVELLRAGATAGSPFVNASATHDLAALRAFWVLGGDFALLLGGGGGLALAQSHYTLAPTTTDVPPANFDANALRSVIEITAAGRARIFRGLEARAEVSAAVRDGKLEILPLLGAGVAF